MPSDTTPGQRFTQLIQQLGLTKNSFAQSLGKTATVIQHIVDERNKPGYDLMNKVREVYPNVLGDWLLFGEGPMLRGDGASTEIAEAARPVSIAGGIEPTDIPTTSPRRRPGDGLLQPADIAATLALASAAPDKVSSSAAMPSQRSVPGQSPDASPLAAAEPMLPAAALAAAVPALPAAAPDPAYLATALHTMQLQHQLALTEQRNQHLLEQQALLKQMVELLQRA